MALDNELYEALTLFYSSPIMVHPTLNMLDDDRTNELNEPTPITRDDLDNDPDVEQHVEAVVPHSSTSNNLTDYIAQSLGAGGNTLPSQYVWYSGHKYRVGTLVEYKNSVYQIDRISDNDNFVGIYVYYLKGDDSLEPSI